MGRVTTMLFNNLTTKVEHATAAISADLLSVLAWIKPVSHGEGGVGAVLLGSEFGAGFQFRCRSTNTTMQLRKSFTTTSGVFRAASGAMNTFNQWWVVGFTYDASSASNVPTWYLRDTVTARLLSTSANTTVTAPVGTSTNGTGYCAGNDNAQAMTFDGDICYLQAWNVILSADDMNRAMDYPGTVTSGLQLYIKMLTSTDGTDHSGNGYDGTVTDGATGALPPIPISDVPLFANRRRSMRGLIVR